MKIFLALFIIVLLWLPRIARANNYGQTSVMSQCPLGSPEAEEIFQEARKYWLGREGNKKNPKKAEEMFEKAMFMGHSKAPLAIGGIYKWDYRKQYAEDKRLKYMLRMYNEGIKMGCAEGHVLLAECYSKGWGVTLDYDKAVEEIKQGVAKGSPKAMEFYGQHLVQIKKRIEEGRDMLRKSMALGNGDAGDPLATSYLGKDDDRVYAALRNGSKLGSKRCLGRLAYNYLQGNYGQSKNKILYDCVTKIEESINSFYPPKPVENFDELCPHPTPLNVEP